MLMLREYNAFPVGAGFVNMSHKKPSIANKALNSFHEGIIFVMVLVLQQRSQGGGIALVPLQHQKRNKAFPTVLKAITQQMHYLDIGATTGLKTPTKYFNKFSPPVRFSHKLDFCLLQFVNKITAVLQGVEYNMQEAVDAVEAWMMSLPNPKKVNIIFSILQTKPQDCILRMKIKPNSTLHQIGILEQTQKIYTNHVDWFASQVGEGKQKLQQYISDTEKDHISVYNGCEHLKKEHCGCNYAGYPGNTMNRPSLRKLMLNSENVYKRCNACLIKNKPAGCGYSNKNRWAFLQCLHYT